eukprot:TRINITY_DN3029_c0_g1_i1.p1 TRINITY_DN3029_c0_g1~~TRINITY_DN3029_c0_g1_i1.p1  ORF type:complete len:485 (+),score=105.42 TRINITY_DN3029_c0_g1_i1:29-1456(+)
MDTEEFKTWGYKMIDMIADYRTSLQNGTTRVLSSSEPGQVIDALPTEAPEQGQDFEEIMEDVQSVIMPHLTHWQHPNWFAFFASNSSYPSILGELLSAGLAQQGMLWETSPACTELEHVVMDWLAKLLQLPHEFTIESGVGGGVLQGTASETVLVCLVAARNKSAKKLGIEDPAVLSNRLVVYCTELTHSSITKGCKVAGIPAANIRQVDLDEELGMDPKKLEEQIIQDQNNGLVPSFICATVGTTSLTSNDPLPEIGLVSQKYDLWFHIDAAFSGSACICPEYRPMIDGVELADSFNFNPAKWLLTNFDCSAHFVKDRNMLIESMNIDAAYYPSPKDRAIDYRHWTVALGRRFRALKLWFVLRNYGAEKLRAMIRDHIDYAKQLEEWIKEDDRFEISTKRTVSLVTFRMKTNNEDNQYICDQIKSDGEFYLGPTHFRGQTIIRFAIGSIGTKLENVKACWSKIQEIADGINPRQ